MATGSPGLRFWWRTFEDVQALFAEGQGEEGGADAPLPTKVYRGLPRHVLPAPARTLHRPGPSAPGPLTEALVSTLLQHAYGLCRMELGPHAVWPYHRTVASARCFHPVQLYLWTPGPAGGLAAGCFHYDSAHHALTRLRTGGVPTSLVSRAGTALLVAAVNFRKTAFRYRDYAYRLCAQEAGMTVGNALLAAEVLGLAGRVRHRFDDGAVNRALGLDSDEESAFALVELVPRHGEWPSASAHPLTPLHPLVVENRAADPAHWAGLTALDRSARLCGQAEPAVDVRDFHRPPEPSAGPVRQLPTSAAPVDLARALRARDSGGRMFQPRGTALPYEELTATLRGALAPVEADHTGGASPPLVDCHVLVRNVTGLPPGTYRLTADGRLTGLPGRAEAERTVVAMLCDRTPSVNAATAPLLVFLGVDRVAGDRWFGDRGYRVLHQEAGIVAQRVCVGAASAGLSARVTNGYHEVPVRALVGADAAYVPVFTLVVGRRGPSAQYEPALTW